MFDPDGTRPSEKKLARCLDKNKEKKENKIAECEADSDPAPVESESTVDPVDPDLVESESTVDPDPVESESTVDPDPVDPASPDEDGCPGVPVAIPTSCSAYTCDAILEIFEYTEVRVHEHNERRRKHRDTPDVTSNLDIAC